MPPRVPTRALFNIPLGTPATAGGATAAARPSANPRTTSSPPTSPRVRSLYTTSVAGGPSRLTSSSSTRRPSGSRLERKTSPTSHARAFHGSNSTNAPQKNPYDALGVAKDASSSDIKKAYYGLAKKWHPDTSKEPGAADKFQEIQAAYDILSDDTKRQAYDRYGSASQQEGFDPDMYARGGAGGFGGFQDFGSAFGGRGGGNAGDLFEQLFGGAFGGGMGGMGGAGGSPFGGAGPRARTMRGDDLEADVTLSFMDAAAGAHRKIKITPVVDCPPCHGSGLKPGEQKSTCTVCRGTGQQAFQVQGMFMASTCSACHGTGTVIPPKARCGECGGVGRVKEQREVEVDIPGGIEDGMKIKIPNAGDMPLSASGPPGDLYVRVNVKPSTQFRRQGTNIYHDAKVPLQTALLGGKVRIPTLEGDVDVRIREGTQNGQEAVLKGRGVKSLYGRKGDRGDLVVTWKVQIPRSLSSFQKKIMQAFADDVEGRDPHIHFDSPGASNNVDPAASSPEPPKERTAKKSESKEGSAAEPKPKTTRKRKPLLQSDKQEVGTRSEKPVEMPPVEPEAEADVNKPAEAATEAKPTEAEKAADPATDAEAKPEPTAETKSSSDPDTAPDEEKKKATG